MDERTTNRNDMVLLSNEWWMELRRSFDSTIRSTVQYQVFESGFLRLLIIPVPMEDVTRALILTNIPEFHSARSESGAKLLSQCMIFPPLGEFPATLDDITHGDNERHSVYPPDQYFHMSDKSPLAYCFDRVSSGALSHLPCNNVLSHHQLAVCAEFPVVLTANHDVGNDEITKPLTKLPLPVLLRQGNSPKSERSSHLFPHQKCTVGWMMDIENGMSPPLFCPLANLFGGYHVVW